MSKPFLLIAFVLIMVSCRQQTDEIRPDKRSAATGEQIDKLIKKGHSMRYDGKDVLPKLIASLDSLNHMGDNKRGQIYADVFRSYSYWFATDYTSGMKAALRALTNAEKWRISEPVPEIYSIMANMHKENGNYEKAFADCEKGLAEARLNKDTTYIISLLGLNAMFTHGYYRKTNRPAEDHTSLQMQFEALKLAEAEPKYEATRIRFYNNIGQTFKEKGNYQQALLYANKAAGLAIKHNQMRSLTYSYNWIGEAYYYMGERKKGVAYLDSAIAISKKIAMPYREMEINDAMHWCYISTKDYEPAIAKLKRFNKLRDSLQIAKNEKQISELQLQYDNVKKDRQITQLNEVNKSNRQKMLIILTGLLIFIIFLGIILYQNRSIHLKNAEMRSTNQQLNAALLAIAHIQSHHVRKPVASILGLMNIIKANGYEADREVLEKMDDAAQQLDERIRAVIQETEVSADKG